MFLKILKKLYILIVVFFIQCTSIGNDVVENNKFFKKNGSENFVYNDSLSNKLKELNASFKSEEFHKYFANLHKTGLFNGNILIAQKGVVIYEESFGYSNYAKRDSLNLKSEFQIASVSKQFTAVAIMQLFEKGLINFTDDVKKYIPNFPYNGVTIHMLLSHTSGLPNYIYMCDRYYNKKDSAVSNEAVLNCFSKYHPRKDFASGSRFTYSNTGYIILSQIVSVVTGKPFDEYLSENIFKPLGMNNTYVYVKGKTKASKHATLGYKYGREVADDIFLNGVTGDKGIYSTVEDLYKWDQGLYTNKIIKYSTLEENAFTPQGKCETVKYNYGYGWRMYNREDGEKVLYHSGWWYGYQSLLIHLQKDSTTIVVLRNKKTNLKISHSKLFDVLYQNSSMEGKSSI